MTLAERILECSRCLSSTAVPHAFGGAIALAYWTLDPRGTSDIDLNVFVASKACSEALAALPSDVERPEGIEAQIARDGQARLWWDGTPVDVFFDYAPVHAQAARHADLVPFAGDQIPVLGPVELAAFKAMFDRTRDWADIEAMLAAETLDLAGVRALLDDMLDADDPRYARLSEASRRARGS